MTTELRTAAEARKTEVRAYAATEMDRLLAKADAAKAADCRARFTPILEAVMDETAWSSLVNDIDNKTFFLLAMDRYRAALRA